MVLHGQHPTLLPNDCLRIIDLFSHLLTTDVVNKINEIDSYNKGFIHFHVIISVSKNLLLLILMLNTTLGC